MTVKKLRQQMHAAERRIGDRPAFRKPLKIGDHEQVRLMKIVNGNEGYCPACLMTGFPASDIGERCPGCRRDYITPGGKMNLLTVTKRAMGTFG